MLVCALFEPFALWQAVWERPDLKGKTLVTLLKDKVHHLSKEARQSGIKSGMSLEGARGQCKDLGIVETDAPTLKSAWEGLLAQLYGFTDQIESVKPGVCFLDLEPKQMRQVAEVFGALVASGENQEQSYLLALTTPQGNVSSFSGKDIQNRIAAIPLYVLRALGISPLTLERLSWLGLYKLGDLMKWSKSQLQGYLGSEANLIIRYLHGPFRNNVLTYTPPITFNANYDFEDSVLEPYLFEPVIKFLCQQLSNDLNDKAASRLSLKAVSSRLMFSSTKVSHYPLRDVGMLERLASLALHDSGILGLEIDSIELTLSGIYRPVRQGHLWQQRENVEVAVSKVSERYPGKLLKIQHIDPYTPLSEFAYKLIPFENGQSKVSEVRNARGRTTKQPTLQSQGILGF
jgi:nucleotidyltransferase/DNA polymerase involved in DNA repair